MEMDIDDLLSRNRPVSIPTKRAIYVWVYSKSEQTRQNRKKQQLKIPKQLSGAFWVHGGANCWWPSLSLHKSGRTRWGWSSRPATEPRNHRAQQRVVVVSTNPTFQKGPFSDESSTTVDYDDNYCDPHLD